MKTANVDAFVKAGVNNTGARLLRIAHETVLAAFPRRRFFTAVIALDVLIEVRPAAVKNRVVVGRQCQIDSRRFCLGHGHHLKRADRDQDD